eukprot:Em0004g1057a
MATGIVLWLYSFGGMYGLPWPDLQTVGLYVSSNLDIAAVLEGSHKQEQAPDTKASLLYLNVSDTQRIPLERVKLPADVNASDIYISVLTMPRNHPTRFATHLFTWMQTVNPDQVRIITEASDDEFINGAKKMGYHVVPSGCHDIGDHNALVMCCKSGRQFEEYYRARRAGEKYKWYCHADDDIYVNIVGLTKMLQSYNPKDKVYLGQWHYLQKYFFHTPRVIHLAPGLLSFPERKRDNFRYSSGNTYCISDPLMMELEKYLSGNDYVESCKKAQVSMDDVLVGVVIDGILGYDLIEPRNFRTELDSYGEFSVDDLKQASTVALGRVIVPKTKFGNHDNTRLLSYHCFIYPEVSWCAMG